MGVTPPQPWGSGVGEGATSGTSKAYVDSLFRFCNGGACPDDTYDGSSPTWPAGSGGGTAGSWATVASDYSGAWVEDSVFVVTVLIVIVFTTLPFYWVDQFNSPPKWGPRNEYLAGVNWRVACDNYDVATLNALGLS